MSYLPNGPWDLVKRPQYIEEATYGTTPVASPSFTSAGVNSELSITMKESIDRYRQLGSRNVYKFLETGELYSFELHYNPISTALIRYGTETPNASGTIAKALSFLYSQNRDVAGTMTEHYVFLKGARTDKIRIECTPDNIKVTQNFLCQNVTTPSTSHGLTTPTFAPADTAAPWVGPTSGSNPLVHNSNNYDADRFVFEVSYNLDAIKPNGSTLIQFLTPTNCTVSGEFDVLHKDDLLEADMKTLSPRTMTYTLNSTGPKTATFTNAVIVGLERGHKATENSARRDNFKFEAESVSVTA